MQSLNFCAIIPARSNSKGFPNKNVAQLKGHPLLAYSIKAALDSKNISRTILSTDSTKYAEIGKSYGAEVPFLRPPELSLDGSRDIEFLQHAVEYIKSQKQTLPHAFVLLRPTSPIRRKDMVDNAIKRFSSISEATSLKSIIPSPYTPYKMWFREKELLKPVVRIPDGLIDPQDAPRQELPTVWMQAGSIDIISTKTILEGSASGEKITFYEMEATDYCDIDAPDDLVRAEDIFSSDGYVCFEAK